MQKLNLGEGYNDSVAETTPVSGVVNSQPPASAAMPQASSAPTHPTIRGTQKGSSMARKKTLPALLSLIAIGAGILTGYGAYQLQAKTGVIPGVGSPAPLQQVAGDSVKAGDVFGVQDEKTFKDDAEGYLDKGGLDGEGSHHLLRPGGPSQTVYLTSSVTDLSKFEGMQVKVWGETFKAQKAGWFMDVGRVQIVDPQGSKPEED